MIVRDLSARFDIPTGLVERMQQRGILYDRDMDGAFFQLYSRTFARGRRLTSPLELRISP